jgi:dolichyl-phosphate beta-glucosyltransferase
MLSVIIPAYNEEDRIPDTLKKLSSITRRLGIPAEIIVVNDGSTDATAVRVSELEQSLGIKQLILQKNSGKGAAIRQGIRKTNGDMILIMDADGSSAMSDIPTLLNAGALADIIVASRYSKGSIILNPPPFTRKLLTAASRVGNQMLGLDVRDSRCGFKLIKKDAACALVEVLSVNRFGFDIELLYAAKKMGFTVHEVPITWSYSDGSKVMVFRDSTKAVLEIIQILINSLLGKYTPR